MKKKEKKKESQLSQAHLPVLAASEVTQPCHWSPFIIRATGLRRPTVEPFPPFAMTYLHFSSVLKHPLLCPAQR